MAPVMPLWLCLALMAAPFVMLAHRVWRDHLSFKGWLSRYIEALAPIKVKLWLRSPTGC
jgi:hypothetical protein